jgi:hypothetical protein
VDNSGANGDGRSTSPFNNLTSAAAVDGIGDIIYIFTGGGNYTGGITLLNNEQVIGNGVALVVNTITLRAAGARPTVVNAGGAGMTLAQNNTLTGFNFGASTGFSITGTSVGTLTVNNMLINNTSGGALDLTGVGTPTVSVTLDSTTSTSGAKNVNLVGMNGSFALGSGALSGATGNALDVNGGNGGITFTGPISNSGGRQVSIINKTAGTVALPGAISGTGTGIFLNANASTTINFTGGVILSTGTNDAFTATSSGTITVTGAANTLTTTTGQALKVTSTTIAGTGLTFATISSNGGTNNGITLDTTGAGPFTVTGTGGAASGGAILNKNGSDSNTTQGIGIYLNAVSGAVSLTRMDIQGCQNYGIRGIGVTGGMTLDNSTVGTTTKNGTTYAVDAEAVTGQQGEASLRFTNLTGTVAFSNDSFDRGFGKTVHIFNSTAGSTLTLNITNSTLRQILNAGNGGDAGGNSTDALFMQGINNVTMNLNVSGSHFTSYRQFGILTDARDTSTMNIDVGTCDFSNDNTGNVNASASINFSGGGATTTDVFVHYNVHNNTFRHGSVATGTPSNGGAHIVSGGVSGGVKMDGKILNNAIGVTGVPFTGAGNAADALRLFASGNNAATTRISGSTHTRYLVQGNTIKRWGETGIQFNARQGNSTIDATVLGNTIDEPGTAAQGAFAAIWVNSGALGGDTNQVNIAIGSATVAADKNTMQNSDPSNATDVFLDKNTCAGCASTLNLYQNGSDAAGGTTEAKASDVLKDDNNPTLDLLAGFTNASTIGFIPGLPPQPTAAQPVDDTARRQPNEVSPATTLAQANAPVAPASVAAAPVAQVSAKAHRSSMVTPKADAAEIAGVDRGERMLSHHAVRNSSRRSADSPDAPLVTVSVALGTLPALPAGKVVTIKYAVTINTPPLVRQISAQGTVTFNGNPGGSVNTTDFSPPNGPTTVTLIDTLVTWNGSIDTNWNTANNWTVPGGAPYAPGVTNPAVNDVVIPNVGAQPNITVGGGDIGIYSLSLANGRTLTIDTGRVLTIGGLPGGNLTLDGIISGGELRLGSGAHVISNAGGTGSLSSTNLMTVLSGSTVTLNNNLQAGALTVNAGGSMDITSRTLSLNGAGGLAVPGGATLTTTTSTVVFNGTVAQSAAGIAYNNLTINNTAAGAPNALGATLTGPATVNGTLALTSNDLNTSTFTLTQPNTTASTGAGDVVGTITRTAAFATTTITFGNPNNQITFGAAGTKPTSLTVVMAKAAPATYATAVLRNYTISQAGTNTSTATVRLHYLDSELNGNVPETQLGLRRLRTGDNHWVAAPPPPNVPNRDGSANWVEAPAVPGVSGTDLPTQWTFSTLVPTAANGVVTGRIVDDQGTAVEGAVVRLEGTQSRKFITDANGFYRFENVETTGFYIVTPSRANYSFTPSSRSFSQIGDTTEATFGATLATSTFANPLDTPEYFVRQNYIDFLGREPDEAGFNFWSDQILGCGNDTDCISRKRENVSAAYFLSIEFQKTGGLVDGLYRSAYGVRPDFGQFMPDTRAVGLGVVVGVEGWEAKLAANKEAFVNAFVNRPAFVGVYGNLGNSDYVDALISHTGVSFTASERDALVSGLGTGTMTRAEALRSIAENNRFANAKFNEAFVMMEYFGYLRRDADVGGFAFWLNKLNEFNGNFERAEMVKAFIISGEYRDRFPR